MTCFSAGGHAYRPPHDGPDIVVLDEHLIVADKPSGLLSVPGRGDDKADCAEARLARDHGWVRAVHRLDMDTSGLIVFARSSESHRALSAAFAARSVDKTYLAHVWGVPQIASGRIDAPLIADWPNRPRQMIDAARGKTAITDWKLGDVGVQSSELSLHPKTGRSHQLRVHLASIGHPILGDPFYAHAEARAAAPRLMLHAAELAFSHPVTGARVTLRSPAPFPPLV